MTTIYKMTVALGLLALTTAPIFAAGLTIPAPDSAMTDSSWSGAYIGAVGGFGYNKVDSTDGYLEESNTVEGWSGNIGGTVGYNYRFDNFVAGAEADLSLSGFSKSLDLSSDRNRQQSSLGPYATLRARGGVLAGDLLFYGTAGLAVASVQHKSEWVFEDENLCGDTTAYTSCVDQIQPGFVAGIGVEMQLAPEWSAKAEYLHFAFQSISTTETHSDYQYDWQDSMDTFRVGLNYHPQ